MLTARHLPRGARASMRHSLITIGCPRRKRLTQAVSDTVPGGSGVQNGQGDCLDRGSRACVTRAHPDSIATAPARSWCVYFANLSPTSDIVHRAGETATRCAPLMAGMLP